MTMTDLAAVLGTPLSTTTRMVDRLETKNLIERLRSEQDRRIVVVRNSARGQMFYDTFQRHHFELARRMLEPLSFGEREILLELMEKLTHGLSGSGARQDRG
jgi:DNA-binding MarR family transcriptional regulator